MKKCWFGSEDVGAIHYFRQWDPDGGWILIKVLNHPHWGKVTQSAWQEVF